MPLVPYGFGKGSHGQKKGGYLLYMMGNVVGLLAHLGHDIGYVILNFAEPTMVLVQLIPQDQS